MRKRPVSMKKAMRAMMDFRYLWMEDSDEQAIETLDMWLENWIERKERCPNCGKFNEYDE